MVDTLGFGQSGTKSADPSTRRDRRHGDMNRGHGEEFLDALFEPVNAFVEIAALNARTLEIDQVVGVRGRGKQRSDGYELEELTMQGFSSNSLNLGPR